MVGVNVLAKVSTLFNSKFFGVTFEVSNFCLQGPLNFKGKTNIYTLTFESLSKVTKNGHL